MQLISRDEFVYMLQKARISKRLSKEIRFVPEETANWEERDFLAVTNRSRSEGVLLIPFISASPIPFRLQPRGANSSGRVEAVICDICASWRRGTASATITFQRQNSSFSFIVCGDLDCSLHVRNKTAAAKVSRTQLRENMTEEGRIARLKHRLHSMLDLVQ